MQKYSGDPLYQLFLAKYPILQSLSARVEKKPKFSNFSSPLIIPIKVESSPFSQKDSPYQNIDSVEDEETPQLSKKGSIRLKSIIANRENLFEVTEEKKELKESKSNFGTTSSSDNCSDSENEVEELRLGYLSDENDKKSRTLRRATYKQNKFYNKVFHWSRTVVGIKDFEFIKLISKGAFGRVWMVRRKLMGDIYAMKIINFTSKVHLFTYCSNLVCFLDGKESIRFH